MAFRRVLLKVSGEGLCAPDGSGYDPDAVRALAAEVDGVAAEGAAVAVVLGGGNLIRGRDLPADLVARTDADAAGMLATVANSLVLAAALRRAGRASRVFTAVSMPDVAEPFTALRAREAMDRGEVALLGGGTGRPYFTTDTAGVLRALEVGAEVFVKATNVDGVYDRDPRRHPDAARLPRLSFEEAVDRRLGVMDRTAFTLCAENGLPVVVLSLRPAGNLLRAVRGEDVGTRIG